MSATPENEFLGNTANKAFAGHAFVKGQPIAALMLKLPPDFWQANENKNGRGRPSGAAKERVLRDIKTLAARDIVDAVLKRDGMTATEIERMALVMSATGATTERDDFSSTTDRAKANARQHRRMIKNARIELSHFETKVDINASEPGSWKWTAVCGDGSAWLYFWRGEIVECVACPGIKPGHWILKATE